MNLLKTLKYLSMLALVAGMALTLGAPADAQQKVRWKMQSAWSSTLPHLGTSGVRFVDDVKVASGGRFVIKFFEPGALIPPLECFDAVGRGSIESCWTTPGYHTGRYPAASFFTAVPFGPGFGEFMAWKIFGGGNKLRDDIYKKHNLIAIDILATGPETSGWFRTEMTFEKLRGIKMRFFGLGAKVMQKVGVSTQLLAAADIYPALERGVIDATEFSMPAMDIRLGFYQIAKYNYFPGWHQNTSVSELLMNRDKWNALSKQNKRILTNAAGAQVAYTYAETEALNFGAMLEMKNKYGVKIRRWPDSTLAKFEKAWNEVVVEESAKDPLFKKVAESFYAFRKKYKIWLDAQTLKATYLK